MDDPNITMEEYIKALRKKKLVGVVRSIVFNDTLTSEAALSCEPTVSSLNNDEIDFRISFDESDDEDCTSIAEYGISTSIGYGVSKFLSNTTYSFKLINTAYPLPLDTAYRSSGKETEILTEEEETIRSHGRTNFKKYMEKAQTESHLSITSNDINIELSKEFFKEMQVNAYHGWIDEDVINHIAMVLKMIDSIYIPGEGKITIWEELIEKFFCKFYPESYDEEEEMLDEGDNWGIDPLESISLVNSSFDKHMKMDGRTKKVLFHAWINGNWNV
ncbi:hypothetical protein Tco_0546521 [Tanacetum coccineum]